MQVQLVDESEFSLHCLKGYDGLTLRFTPAGCLYDVRHREIQINQVLASPLSGGVHRIYLRELPAEPGDGEMTAREIVGPGATDVAVAFLDDRVCWSGRWRGVDFQVTCRPGSSYLGWSFDVSVHAASAPLVDAAAAAGRRFDAVLVQDVGLATRGHVRNNELFTSQYLDHAAHHADDAGWLVMTRQNLSQGPNAQHPWLLQGCLPQSAGFCTDGFDFFGEASRAGEPPAALRRPVIGHRVRQYETAYVAIQSAAATLDAGRSIRWRFFASYRPHHPRASTPGDAVAQLAEVQEGDTEAANNDRAPEIMARPIENVVRSAEMLPVNDLDDADLQHHFGDQSTWRHVERANDRPVSFFRGAGADHVVLRAKELSVARPHGHIVRAGRGLMPDDDLLSCTAYASGVFASQLTVGNASLAKLLSGVREPLNLCRTQGLRILVRTAPGTPWQMLGAPSAFEMSLDGARWVYRHPTGSVCVRMIAYADLPAITFRLTAEPADGRQPSDGVEWLVCGEIAAAPAEYDQRSLLTVDAAARRMVVRPERESLLGQRLSALAFHLVTSTPEVVQRLGGDELLFADGAPRRLPYFAWQTQPTRRFAFSVFGSTSPNAPVEAVLARLEERTDSSASDDGPSPLWQHVTAGSILRMSGVRPSADWSAVADTLRWFARDAVIHLATPRGLEQPNGGAWGVRDVCQGPVEFLQAYGRHDEVAAILKRVFSQQYDRRGDWPQWFMFPPFSSIQSTHSHGDVILWPLKALCDHLEETGDEGILHASLPYTDDETFAPTTRQEPLIRHVDRLIEVIESQFLPGLSLPRYGEGDWDDSLQPADPALRDRMVSAWTAALLYQTLCRYAGAMRHFGDDARAHAAEQLAGAVRDDFQRHLLPEGVVAGFAVFELAPTPRASEYLLHPTDRRTGLKYRLIPMTRGVLGEIFSPEQARRHMKLVADNLLFPDGARLMDRPTAYAGGVERTFRRAESAAFFGREIGLQYVHAHLRYCEAMAKIGDAEALWRGLRVVNPILCTSLVPNARSRQRNCYFSSSDAAFCDRRDASARYASLRAGEVPVDAGWRIYSSGPGIYANVVIRHLLGLRRRLGQVEFDPVLPEALNGAEFERDESGRRVYYRFSLGSESGQTGVAVNGVPLSVEPLPNPYRGGGVRVSTVALERALVAGANVIEITFPRR